MKTSLNQLIFEYQLEINCNVDENQEMYSGLSKLDFNTKGFKRGSVNIIAARKGNAMMAFKNQLVSSAIFKTTIISKKNVNTVMYSLLSQDSCISEKKIAYKFFQENELIQLNKSFTEIQKLPIYIKKKKILTLDFLENYLKKNSQIESILIEDLGSFKEKEVLVLKGLKQLVKKYNILFFAFYELISVDNAKVYDEIKPDLKEFTQKFSLTETEKNIDNLIFIFRPEFYNINHFKETEISTEKKAEFIIFNKNQERKSVLVGFSGAKRMFYDIGIDESNWVEKLKSLAE